MPKLTEEQVRSVVTAIKHLISAEIAAQSDNDPDSMGSWFEEEALVKVLLLALGGIR